MGSEPRHPLLTRRELLQAGLAAGAGLAAWPLLSRVSLAGASPTLAKFVDPLPVPRIARPTGLRRGVPQYTVTMTQCRQKVHRDLPPTPLWGYGGTWPGPTLEARSGEPLDVTWVNELPGAHLLEAAYDETLCGTDLDEPHARTAVHLHGARVLPEHDGYPEAWFTRDWRQTGPFFTTKTYHYPNAQPAAPLWYHDHALGISRLNAYGGLAGCYFIRDEAEDALDLPRGRYEVPLILQDRQFNPDGSLHYPIVQGGTRQAWIPEVFGDVACVNGVAFPFLEVEPRRYRFRLVNGSNCRFYRLSLVDRAGHGLALHQIGTDAGLLPAPLRLPDLLLAPGERADVIVDFRSAAGRDVLLRNDAPAPFPGGGDVRLPDIMQVRVTRPLAGRDGSALPSSLAPVPLLLPSQAQAERDIMLSQADRPADGFPIVALLGGSPLQAGATNPSGGARWDDPVTEAPRAGAVEIWNLVNTTPDAHPIHVHLVAFQVLERRYFDLPRFLRTGQVHVVGAAIPPAPNERPAWKDTVTAFPGLDAHGNVLGLVTRIIARYDLPPGARIVPGARFRYAYHCHLLEHEDNEMMRPFEVVVPVT
jgi:spore coat protein A